MKCNRAELIKGLDLLKHAVEKYATITCLSECSLKTVGDRLELSGTNLSNTINVYLSSEGELPAMAFDYQVLSRVLKAAKKKRGESIELLPGDDGSLLVNVASRKFAVDSGSNVLDRPKTPEGKGDEYFHSFHAPSFDAALRYAAIAVSKDNSRTNLCRMLIDGEGNVVATDGHRMHIADGIPGFTDPGDAPMSVAITCHDAIIAAIKATNASWVMGRLSGNGVLQMSIEGGGLDVIITEKTEEATTFPPWRQIVPNHSDNYAVGALAMRECLETAVKIAKAMRIELNNGVTVTVNGAAKVSIPNARYEETVALVSEATTEAIYGVNPVYMLDALKGGSSHVLVHFGDALEATVVEFDGFKGLVMPCKVG